MLTFERSLRLAMLFLIMVVGFLSSCGTPPTPLSTPTRHSEPTVEPTAPPSPTQTSTIEPTPPATTAPTATPSPDPTATFTPLPPTFDPTPPPPLDPASEDFADRLRAYVQLVADMLNAGRSVDDTLDTVVAWSTPEGTEGGRENVWQAATDLDGDGVEERLMSLPLPGVGCGVTFCPRVVAIFERRGDRFSPGTIIPTGEDMLVLGAPMLRFSEDINGDGRTEVVIQERSCGAHTCFIHVLVGHWDGSTWLDLTADPIDQAYSDLVIEDRDGDGVLEFSMTGGMSGSVGAGLQRPHTRVFDWQEGAYRLVEDIPASSDHPYYLMLDANTALAEGEYETALGLATQALENPGFEDTMAPVEPLDKARILSYAAAETMLVHALSGDIESMEAVLARARDISDVTDNIYLDAAERLLTAYRETGDAISACAAMEAVVSEPSEPPVFFQWYGYGTERITVDQICPLDPPAAGATPRL